MAGREKRVQEEEEEDTSKSQYWCVCVCVSTEGDVSTKSFPLISINMYEINLN